MTTILIINSVALLISVIFGTVAFELFLRAERKLAKHNESVVFKEKK